MARARGPSSTRSSWWPWIIGAAAVAIVVVISTHLTEGRSILAAARAADPRWLALAGLLQCGTYVAEAEVWREVTCRAGCSVSLLKAIEISLGKLFVDQTLPTGGVSGSILAATALGRHGVSAHVVAASVVVERASFLSAYVVALAAALVLAVHDGRANRVIVIAAAVFGAASALVAVGLVQLAGQRRWRMPRMLRHLGPLHGVLRVVRRADPRVARNPRLLLLALCLQLIVIALDTTTMVTIVRALGGTVATSGVFISFMTSSLFRTIGAVPGGLGTFEASSVFTLRMAGASLPIAVSATMVFRGMSFWLPMAPGVWFARHTLRRRRPGETPAARRAIRST